MKVNVIYFKIKEINITIFVNTIKNNFIYYKYKRGIFI